MEVDYLGFHQHILNVSFAIHCHTTGHGTWTNDRSRFDSRFLALVLVQLNAQVSILEFKQHWPQLVCGRVTISHMAPFLQICFVRKKMDIILYQDHRGGPSNLQ